MLRKVLRNDSDKSRHSTINSRSAHVRIVLDAVTSRNSEKSKEERAGEIDYTKQSLTPLCRRTMRAGGAEEPVFCQFHLPHERAIGYGARGLNVREPYLLPQGRTGKGSRSERSGNIHEPRAVELPPQHSSLFLDVSHADKPNAPEKPATFFFFFLFCPPAWKYFPVWPTFNGKTMSLIGHATSAVSLSATIQVVYT